MSEHDEEPASWREWFRINSQTIEDGFSPTQKIHACGIYELYEIVEKQAEQIERLEKREHDTDWFILGLEDRIDRQAQAIQMLAGFLVFEEEQIQELLHPIQVLFPAKLTLLASIQGDSNIMQVTPVFGFTEADGSVTTTVDAGHQIGTPTFLWTTSGSGTIADPSASVLTITPADPANIDDVVTCEASNVATDLNGGVQTLTATADLSDGATAPTVLFPSQLSLTVSA